MSVSAYTLDRLVSKLAMPVGSCTALSMVSSQMVKCHLIKPLEVEMTPSIPSLVKLVQENMCLELCLWTWSPLLLVGYQGIFFEGVMNINSTGILRSKFSVTFE